MITNIAQSFRLESSFSYNRITDTVFNEPLSTEYARSAVRTCFGEDVLHTLEPVMGGEDFGSFMVNRPGAFIVLGQAAPDAAANVSQGVHTPRYDFNDDVIPHAVEYFAELAEMRMPLKQRETMDMAAL
jgi:hippurate hydrolase